MSDLHIVRVPESPDNPINADEWLNCIESDPEIQRANSADEPAGWIIATVTGAEEWETLRWSEGSISASYPQDKMVSKMVEIAARLGAVLVSDGIRFKVDGDGQLVEDSESEAFLPADTNARDEIHPSEKEDPLPPVIRWPYFGPDPEDRPPPWILRLQSCRSDIEFPLAERSLSDALNLPLSEAAKALRTCQLGQPVGIPIPDLEHACLLAERLKEFGIDVAVAGVLNPRN